jgi:hypothetical protein
MSHLGGIVIAEFLIPITIVGWSIFAIFQLSRGVRSGTTLLGSVSRRDKPVLYWLWQSFFLLSAGVLLAILIFWGGGRAPEESGAPVLGMAGAFFILISLVVAYYLVVGFRVGEAAAKIPASRKRRPVVFWSMQVFYATTAVVFFAAGLAIECWQFAG